MVVVCSRYLIGRLIYADLCASACFYHVLVTRPPYNVHFIMCDHVFDVEVHSSYLGCTFRSQIEVRPVFFIPISVRYLSLSSSFKLTSRVIQSWDRSRVDTTYILLRTVAIWLGEHLHPFPPTLAVSCVGSVVVLHRILLVSSVLVQCWFCLVL